MKILITSIVDLKKSQHNRPHQLVKYLSQNNDVTVLSLNDWWKGDQGDLDSYSSEFNDIFNKIDYHYLTHRKIAPFIQEVLFTKKIKELSKEDFDVHLNYNSLITGTRISNYFKTVFDLADDLPEMIRNSPQIPRLLRPFGGLMGDYYLKKAMDNSDAVTISTKVIMDKYKIPEDKTVIIPNGVDTQTFKPYPNAKEDLGLDGFIIGYVGVLREWVDLGPLFECLKDLDKNIKILIVGSEGRYKEKKELAQSMGIADRVIFTGMVPYSDVPKYVSAMDVGVIPFNLNGVSQSALPLKLFEYMACEKPVISTEIIPLKSAFPEELIYVSNVKEYTEAINLVYEDEDFRIKLGKLGRKIALKYNWEHNASTFEKILEKVASD